MKHLSPLLRLETVDKQVFQRMLAPYRMLINLSIESFAKKRKPPFMGRLKGDYREFDRLNPHELGYLWAFNHALWLTITLEVEPRIVLWHPGSKRQKYIPLEGQSLHFSLCRALFEMYPEAAEKLRARKRLERRRSYT